MKPVPGAPKTLAAARRERAVQMFLDQGFPPAKAVRLAAMYLATIRKMAKESEAQRRADAGKIITPSTTPIWMPPKGLPAHERVAARIAHFARMSSEKAHQQAAAVARASDAGGP